MSGIEFPVLCTHVLEPRSTFWGLLLQHWSGLGLAVIRTICRIFELTPTVIGSAQATGMTWGQDGGNSNLRWAAVGGGGGKEKTWASMHEQADYILGHLLMTVRIAARQQPGRRRRLIQNPKHTFPPPGRPGLTPKEEAGNNNNNNAAGWSTSNSRTHNILHVCKAAVGWRRRAAVPVLQRALVRSCTEEWTQPVGRFFFLFLTCSLPLNCQVASDGIFSLNDMSPKLSGGCSRSGRIAACSSILRQLGGGGRPRSACFLWA